MLKYFNFGKIVSKIPEKKINLHRWGHHINESCSYRIEKCMSLQWNDYNSHSCHDKINVSQTKIIDQMYGDIFKKSENPKTQIMKKNHTTITIL